LSHDRWLSPLRRATPRPPWMRERERTEPPLRDALRPRVCRPPPSTATVRHRFDASARVGASARPTRDRSIDRARWSAGAFWGFRAAGRSRGAGRRAWARGRARARVNDDLIILSSFASVRAAFARETRRVRGAMGDGRCDATTRVGVFGRDGCRATGVARARVRAGVSAVKTNE